MITERRDFKSIIVSETLIIPYARAPPVLSLLIRLQLYFDDIESNA